MKNKILLVCGLWLALLGNVWAQTAAKPAGTGTSADPYQIASLDNLYWLSQKTESWSSVFTQTEDIDAAPTKNWPGGAGFSPIGNSDTAFSGSYHGKGHTISNLYINADGNAALFGKSRGKIDSLGLVNVDITASEYAAGLVANQVYASISHCFVTGSIVGVRYVGGLVGYSYESTTKYSYANAMVSGETSVGGLVGNSDKDSDKDSGDDTISNCYSAGTVTSTKGNAGGLVGTSEFTTLINCYSSSAISAQNSYSGLIGSGNVNEDYCYYNDMTTNVPSPKGTSLSIEKMKDSANFSNWDFTDIWQITNGTTFPRLRGMYNYPVIVAKIPKSISTDEGLNVSTTAIPMDGEIYYMISVDNRPSDMDIIDNDLMWTPEKGGLFSFTLVATDENKRSSKQTYNIRVTDYEGDGTPENPYQISELYQLDYVRLFLGKSFILMKDLDFAGTDYVQGKGWNPIGLESDAAFTGNFNGNGKTIKNLYIKRDNAEYVGLFSRTVDATIKNIRLEDVTITGSQFIGSLVGESSYATAISRIDSCFVSGTIQGNNAVGGLVGKNDGIINSTHSSCTVAGVAANNSVGGVVGGLVGFNTATISLSYATGSVSADTAVGGLVGCSYYDTLTKITDCYATGDVSGWRQMGGLVGSAGSTTFKHCYATGTVTALNEPVEDSGYKGIPCGFLGFVYEVNDKSQPNTISKCYYNSDSTKSDIYTDTTTTGLSIVDMKKENSFANWDFDTTWSIVERKTFPTLWHTVPDISLDTIVHNTCKGGNKGSIMLSVNSTDTFTYHWSNDSTSSSISGLVAGIYSVTATSADGTQTLTGAYTIEDGIDYKQYLTFTDVSCGETNNGSADFTKAANMQNTVYNWSNDSIGESINSLTAGDYTVTATDDNQCKQVISFTVGAKVTPVVSLGNDTLLCVGDSLVLTAPTHYGIDGNTFTYSWQDATGATINPNDPTNSTNSTITIKDVEDSQTYYVTVESADGCEAKDDITIGTMDDFRPAICNVAILPSGATEITVDATAFGYLSEYTISRDDDIITTPTTATYIDSAANALAAQRSYTIKGTDICGNPTPKSEPFSTFFMTAIQSGDTVKLQWADTTLSAQSYVLRGETPTTMKTKLSSKAFSCTDTAAPAKAYYQAVIKVEDGICADNVLTNIVLVTRLPIVDFYASDMLIAVGQEVEFIAKVSQSDSIVWDFADGDIATSTDSVVKQTYSQPGKYRVALTAYNTDGKDSLVRAEYITVVGINERDTMACHGDSITFSAFAPTGATYKWSNDMTESKITFLAMENQTISVTITPSGSSTPLTDSVQYMVSVPVSIQNLEIPCVGSVTDVQLEGFLYYSWNGADTVEIPDIKIDTPDTTYTLWVEDEMGCQSSDTLVVGAFMPLPVYTLSADDTVCFRSENVISVTTTGTVQWSGADTAKSITVYDTGEYAVEVTENGCSVSDTVRITVLDQEQIEYLALTVNTAGHVGICWPHSKAFVEYIVEKETDVTGSYLTLDTLSQSDSYIMDSSAAADVSAIVYRITATDTCGHIAPLSASTIHLQIEPQEANELTIKWTEPLNIDGTLYYIFRSTVDGMSILDSTTSFTFIDSVPTENASYAIGVRADVPESLLVGPWQTGYRISNTAKGGYKQLAPSVRFSASRTHVGVGSPIVFTSNTSAADSLAWKFEGGSPATSSDASVTVTYEEKGNYTVSLFASNDEGQDSLIKTDYITVGDVIADSIYFGLDTIKTKIGNYSPLEIVFAPFDTEDQSVTFVSLDTTIVKIVDGMAYAIAEGETYVYASYQQNLKASILVSVSGYAVAKDMVTAYTVWMNVDDTMTIQPVIVPFSLALNWLDISWSVSDTTIATISTSGSVRALATGAVNVVGYDSRSGISVSVPVIIGNELTADSLSIPDSMEIAAGWAYKVPVHVLPVANNGIDITWTVSDPLLVSVTNRGVLKPIKAGSAYVVAKLGNFTDTCYLNILPSKHPVLSVPTEVKVLAGDTQQMFILTMVEDDNTPAEKIKWSFVSSANVTLTESNSILYMSAETGARGIDTVKLIAIDADGLTDTAIFSVRIIGADTTAPVISLTEITILKGTKYKEINLLDYVKDDYTLPTFISTEVSGSLDSTILSEHLNILTMTLTDDAPLYSGELTITARDENGNTAIQHVVVIHSNKPNTKPVIARIPNQEQVAGERFAALQLSNYVSDDYTLPADMKWSVTGMHHFSAYVDKGLLQVYACDPTWTGSEQLKLTATDEQGASAQRTVWFTQLADKPQVWPAKPSVNFAVSSRYTVPGRSLDFYASVNGSRSLSWAFEGAESATSKFTQPTAVYNVQGVYDVSLSAVNTYGTTETLKTDYITVIGIEQRELMICAGETAKINAVAEGFTGFEWSTGETTAAISITPMTSTMYSVTITNAETIIIDSVMVTVTNGLNLGADTVICKGDPLRIGAHGFTEYYWNGSDEKGPEFIHADSVGIYTLFAKDALGCQFNDTLEITQVLPSPQFSLGVDQVLCDGELASLTGGEFEQYSWNTGADAQSISVDTTGDFSLTVTAANGCQNADTVNVYFKKPVVTSIGVVTISDNGQNLIAWERKRGQNIMAYQVYRVAGDDFELVKEVPFDSLSVVIDTDSDPETKLDTYGLRTIDSCGNMSPMSPLHRPLKLTYTRNNDKQVVLSWDRYSVINGDSLPYKSFIIYRGVTGQNLDSIALRNSKIASFTDTSIMAQGNVYYRVAIVLSHTITPEVLKSDSGPFSQSMSNLAEAIAVDTKQAGSDILFDASPNPFGGYVTLSAQASNLAGARYEITNEAGMLVSEGAMSSGLAQADLRNIPVGVYVAKLISAGGATSILIIKQ